MAINDYATLASAVSDWLARADLTGRISDLISLAEVRMSRDLKVARMLTTVTGALTNGAATLPSDFLSPVRMTMAMGGTDMPLEPLTQAQAINDRLASLAYGYAIEGDTLRVIGGSASESYTMTYYAKPPALSLGPNWLILAAPDLYLYATLLEATPYIQDDARMTVWSAGYSRAMEALERVSNESRYSPAARQRVDFRTP